MVPGSSQIVPAAYDGFPNASGQLAYTGCSKTTLYNLCSRTPTVTCNACANTSVRIARCLVQSPA